MKKIMTLICLVVIGVQGFSQTFEIPKNVKMEKDEDFAPYNKDAINAFVWLRDTPANQQADKRKQVSAFLYQWISGTPDVSIGLFDFMGDLATKPDYLLMYMGGWSKYAIETKDADTAKGATAGVEAVVDFYNKNKAALGKNDIIENFAKLKAEGKLAGFVKAGIPKQ